MKGYIDEQATLSKIAENLSDANVQKQQELSDNEKLVTELAKIGENFDEKTSSIQIDMDKAKATVQSQKAENDKQIGIYTKDSNALQKFITDAEAARTAKIKKSDTSTDTDSPTKVDDGNEGTVEDDKNNNGLAVAGDEESPQNSTKKRTFHVADR